MDFETAKSIIRAAISLAFMLLVLRIALSVARLMSYEHHKRWKERHPEPAGDCDDSQPTVCVKCGRLDGYLHAGRGTLNLNKVCQACVEAGHDP